MAEGDTAALVVALSAQLTRFERDMKQAADIAERRTQEIENSFSRVNKAITTQLGLLASSFSGRLGATGAVLTSFGKAGVVAATGLGVAVAAMAAAAQVANKFAEQADKLDQSAQNIGITATQMKALGEAAKAANQDFDRTEQQFTKFVGGVEKLKEAQGELYDSLRKTNPELLLQLTNAKDSAEAITILVKAFGALATQTEKIALARAAGFTRGGVGTLQEIFDRGNIAGLTQGVKNIDEATARVAKLKNELEVLSQQTFDIIGNLVTETSLNLLKNTLKEFQDLVKLIEFARSIDVGRFFRPPGPSNVQQVAADARQAAENAARGRVTPAADLALRNVPAPVPLAPTAEQDLDKFKRAVSIMGEAVTLAEQYTLKQKELAVAVKDGDITEAQRARTLAATSLAQKIAIASTLERLGVANLEQIQAGKLAEIEAARAKGLLTTAQATQAATLAMREANEEAKKLEERRALLPGLKQLQHDAEDLTKAFDKFATSGLKSLEDGLVDIATGTKTVSEAFKAMVDSILKELIRLLLRKAVIGPIADLIGLGAGSIGGGAAPAAASFGGARAGGGPVKAGRFYRIGEQGSELFFPTVDGQVVPKMQAPPGIRSSGGGELNVIVENHGADVQTGEKKRNASGGFDLRIAVRSIMRESFADSSMDSSMQRFGALPRSVVR